MGVRRCAFALAVGLVCSAVSAGATDFVWNLPPGVHPPPVPIGVAMTVERVELGRHLFYDTRLSVNGTTSCATCHEQRLAFTDGRAHARGATGELHPRSAMSLINVAYRDSLTWANPGHRVLEEQILVPMFGTHPIELGLLDHQDAIYAKLLKDPVYRRLFSAAFPGQPTRLDTPKVAGALAAFVRSMVSFRSPFDRHRFYNDDSAFSPAAQRGKRLFFSSTVRCGGCHMADNVTTDLGLNLDGGSKTTSSPATEPAVFMFHNTGLYNLPEPLVYPADNTGLYAVTGNLKDVGKFRVPSLRNIAVTAPYMHDGSIATLDGVLDHYVNGGRARNPLISDSIKPITLSVEERKDIIAFLESLTDREALADPRWSNPWQTTQAKSKTTTAASPPGVSAQRER